MRTVVPLLCLAIYNLHAPGAPPAATLKAWKVRQDPGLPIIPCLAFAVVADPLHLIFDSRSLGRAKVRLGGFPVLVTRQCEQRLLLGYGRGTPGPSITCGTVMGNSDGYSGGNSTTMCSEPPNAAMQLAVNPSMQSEGLPHPR